MAWEERERGGFYYTRSRRVGGQVVREYIGGGLIGELAAEADRRERERRRIETAGKEHERERIKSLAAPVVELCEASEVLVRAALVDAGYRRYQGKWRKRRAS